MTDQTLAARQARYERIVEMRHQDPPMSLAAIGAALDPPLTKERVRKILMNPPRRTGRPGGNPREVAARDELVARLRYWEARRLRTARRGGDTAFADGRIESIREQLLPVEARP